MTSNLPLVARFMELLGSGSVSATKDLLHEEVKLDFPGVRPTTGRGPTVLMLRQIFVGFGRLKFEIVDVIEEGNKICCLWENEGERKDGTPFQNRGATVFRIVDGAIASISDYFKQDAGLGLGA